VTDCKDTLTACFRHATVLMYERPKFLAVNDDLRVPGVCASYQLKLGAGNDGDGRTGVEGYLSPAAHRVEST
jgi:hypothetical protein